MSTVTLSITDELKEKLKKEHNQSELVQMLLIKHFRNEDVDDENKLRTYNLNRCDLCGSAVNVYFCENSHGTIYCKDCLKSVEDWKYGTRFITSKGCRHCNFLPFIKVSL